ncbi:MAG: [NiFe]-hydrogenase assembly chaperone HybE [Burkholderiaceae bacterium]
MHADEPSAAVEAAFSRIERDRMQSVPILNPALRVQALPFERWHGQWLGALVTPWFLNLMLVPGDADGWRSAREGERVFHRFAAGAFAFLGGTENEIGEFQSCSLVSPMTQFTDQVSAMATARAALAMLHVQPRPDADVAPPAGDTAARAPARRVFLFGKA